MRGRLSPTLQVNSPTVQVSPAKELTGSRQVGMMKQERIPNICAAGSVGLVIDQRSTVGIPPRFQTSRRLRAQTPAPLTSCLSFPKFCLSDFEKQDRRRDGESNVLFSRRCSTRCSAGAGGWVEARAPPGPRGADRECAEWGRGGSPHVRRPPAQVLQVQAQVLLRPRPPALRTASQSPPGPRESSSSRSTGGRVGRRSKEPTRPARPPPLAGSPPRPPAARLHNGPTRALARLPPPPPRSTSEGTGRSGQHGGAQETQEADPGSW